MTSLDGRAHQSAHDVAGWLSKLFSAFEEHRLCYAALRVDESLYTPGQELDLLVHPRSMHRSLADIRSVARGAELRLVRWVELPGHAASVVLAWSTDDGVQHYRFDVRTGIRKQGHILLDGRELRHETTVWDPRLRVRRLRDDLECALLAIRNHLDGRAPNERHQRIFSERGSDGDVVEAGTYLGWELTATAVGGWDVRPADKRAGATRRFTTPGRYALRALRGRLRRKGRGMNIILYGPDGVGKSTLAERIATSLRQLDVRDVHLYHHLVEVESLPRRSSTRRYEAKARVYRAAPRSWAVPTVVFASYLKKLLYVIFYVRPALRRGESFVHDRYLLDVFQKLQRTRGVRIPFLEAVLPHLSPQEDFVFVLRAPPDVVSGRTGELTEEEVGEAYDLLAHCLGERGSGQAAWIELDATAPAEQVHAALLERVLSIQDARIHRD